MLRTLTLDSTARSVAGPVEAAPTGSAAFSVSQNGVLVYQPAVAEMRSRLAIVGRSGDEVRTLSDEGEYSNVELSPDGSRLAVSLPDPTTRTRDIWVVDVRARRPIARHVRSEQRAKRRVVDGRQVVVYTSKGLDSTRERSVRAPRHHSSTTA